jgi:hypothetical protein
MIPVCSANNAAADTNNDVLATKFHTIQNSARGHGDKGPAPEKPLRHRVSPLLRRAAIVCTRAVFFFVNTCRINSYNWD